MARMLEAGHRTTYVDLFTPPAGYRLARAVGLTYSLELTTLFAALLALAGIEPSEEAPGDSSKPSHDQKFETGHGKNKERAVGPAEILHVLLDLGDKVTVYCQAGKLRIGGAPNKIHNLLDKVVHTVRPRENSAFHPKLWVLKFARQDSFETYSYRLVVASRNFSATRAYFEVAVALEGESLPRSTNLNNELTSFLRSTCLGMKDLDALCQELSGVRFVPPAGFSDWSFVSQRGLPHSERLFTKLRDCQFNGLAIVSPFLADEFLKRILTEGIKERPILVSTKEALDASAPELLQSFESYYVRDNASPTGDTEDDAPSTSGLHAKIIVGERRGRTEFWIGSANASRRGWFGSNTECMAILNSGSYTLKRFKEDFIWDTAKRVPRPWIVPYQYNPDDPGIEESKKRKERERQIECYIGFLTRAAWSLRFQAGRGEILFRTHEKNPLPSLNHISLSSATVGLLGHSIQQPLDELLNIGKIVIEIKDKKSLTDFLSIELKLNKPPSSVKFLVQADSHFNKREREDSVLQDLIRNEADFWTCFRFLVEGDGSLLSGGFGRGGGDPEGPQDGSKVIPAGILESLLRECARDPDRVMRVRRLLDLAPSQVRTKELNAFWSEFQGAFTEVQGLDL